MNPPNLESIDQTKRTLIDLGLRYGPRLVTALVILIAGLFAARYVGKVLFQWLTKRELEPPVRKLISRIGSLVVLLLFVLMALQNMGVELLPLFAGLGVAGVGVSLAMQGVLSNLSAGLTIIFTKPFRIGEYVALIGVEGQVESIELFSTTLSHLDHSRVVIPNRKIVGEVLQNYGKIRQLDLTVAVAYSGDLEKALRTIYEVLAQNPYVCKEPAPVVVLSAFADSALRISVKPWVQVFDYVTATGAINAAIFTAFRQQDITIPLPRQEVRLLAADADTPK